MDLKIAGKRAFVAGGSAGIGRACAELFVDEGVRVFLVARNEERLRMTAEDLRKRGGTVDLVGADLATATGVDAAFDAAIATMGGVDILVTNAGGPKSGLFGSLTDGDWEKAFSLTLMSTVRMARRALPGMIGRKWGRIVNIASTSVRQPIDGLMLSNSLRMAVTGFAKTLTREIGPNGVTVNTVAPGYTATDRLHEIAAARATMEKKNPEEIFEGWIADTPLGRLADPTEIAAAVVFLASEPAAYIDGTILPVDGGRIRGT